MLYKYVAMETWRSEYNDVFIKLLPVKFQANVAKFGAIYFYIEEVYISTRALFAPPPPPPT